MGVVCADLAMDYFRDLRGSIDHLDLGPKSYCFVVSSAQDPAHPVDRYEFPGPDSDLVKIPLDESFRSVVSRWGQAAMGTARAVDFRPAGPLPSCLAFPRRVGSW